MAPQIEIRGHQVAAAYVYATIVWAVCVLALWPAAIVGLRRALTLYTKSKGTRRDTLFYWAHVVALQLCITIIAVDPWGIYLHFWGTVKLFCESQMAILGGNIILNAFGTSIQAFLAQNSLHVPESVAVFKKYAVVVHSGVSQVLLIVHLAMDRVTTSALLPLFGSIAGIFVAPAFAFVVYKLVKRLRRDHEDSNGLSAERSKKLLRGATVFQRHTYFAVVVMLVLVVVYLYSCLPRLSADADRRYSNDAEFPDYTTNVAFRAEFTFPWVDCAFLVMQAYLLRRHWVAKSLLLPQTTNTGIGTNAKSSVPQTSCKDTTVHEPSADPVGSSNTNEM